MRLALVLLVLAVSAAWAPPRAGAAAWSEVFAAEGDTVVFFGADGLLLRAPFSLATRETLWVPSGGQHLVRLRVSPDGHRVAWLTRAHDRDTTRRLCRAGEILGIPLLDHIIVADTGCYSFREHGLLGPSA